LVALKRSKTKNVSGVVSPLFEHMLGGLLHREAKKNS